MELPLISARIALLLLLALVWEGAPAWAGPSDQALTLINADRERNGRSALRPDPILTEAAARHLELMARIGKITLEPPGRANLMERVRQDGSMLLELRAIVRSALPTPARLISNLKRQDGWHQWIRDPAVDRIGIAFDPGRFTLDNGALTGQVWTVILGNSAARTIPNAAADLLAATNTARVRRGLTKLSENPALSAAALAHAQNMAARGYFAHLSPDGGTVASRVERQNYPYRRVGENLAIGQRAAAQVVQGWTDSPGHAANLYGRNFTEIGVGYVPGPVNLDGSPTSQIWVSVYGRPQE